MSTHSESEKPLQPAVSETQTPTAAIIQVKRSYWPGHSEKARKVAAGRIEALRGNSCFEGPDFKWCLR